jgi:hypothetical protein
VTYYNGAYGLSVRYPAGWRTEQAVEEGVFRRRFLPPSAASDPQPPLSVVLLVRPGEGRLQDDAREFLAGHTLATERDEKRGGVPGRSYAFTSPDGATRYSLVLLREKDRLFGLYAQGAAPLFEKNASAIEEMARTFTPERLAEYPVRREDEFGFSLRVPPSWRETRRFAGKGTLLLQYSSPALAADRNRQTVHASLTMTVEPVDEGTTPESYYDASLKRLGENVAVLKHDRWEGGFADVMRTETPLAISDLKRFFRVEGRRGYTLAFESRDDVFPRVSRWYDQIASSLRTGDEMEK